MKHKIKMLSTTLGSDDGIHVLVYREGEVYEIGTSLHAVFMAMKVCKPSRLSKNKKGS